MCSETPADFLCGYFSVVLEQFSAGYYPKNNSVSGVFKFLLCFLVFGAVSVALTYGRLLYVVALHRRLSMVHENIYRQCCVSLRTKPPLPPPSQTTQIQEPTKVSHRRLSIQWPQHSSTPPEHRRSISVEGPEPKPSANNAEKTVNNQQQVAKSARRSSWIRLSSWRVSANCS
jgi:hypothetical protein